jgi:hypothetical protein
MTKKSLVLVIFVLALATVYVVWFTDWFRTAPLRISSTSRNMGRLQARGNALPFLRFRVDPPARLTDLKVVPLAAFETNKDVVPVWHLVSDSNSVPINEFFYGQHIGGMRPAISGVHEEQLETNLIYRMFVTTGRSAGHHDFELKE